MPWLRYNLGWRRDQIGFDNTDLLDAGEFVPPVDRHQFAQSHPVHRASRSACRCRRVSFSFGQSFFTNDPRIGTGTQQGSLVSQAHAYQMVVGKTLLGTDFRVTLGHVTQEASLAKIDPDTGLQFDEGPSRNRYITAVRPPLLRRRPAAGLRIEGRCA